MGMTCREKREGRPYVGDAGKARKVDWRQVVKGISYQSVSLRFVFLAVGSHGKFLSTGVM